jgi:ornithine carbamoyltransferase
MEQQLGDLRGLTVAWVGDYNNVARSLAEACVMLDAHLRVGSPAGFGPDAGELGRLSLLGHGTVTAFEHPADAVAGAQAVHTDVWTSMGQEAERSARDAAFVGFQVDDALMGRAAPGALFFHCLPAHRGEEVAASVIDGPRSRVVQQGHNRMHAARGLLAWLARTRDGGR